MNTFNHVYKETGLCNFRWLYGATWICSCNFIVMPNHPNNARSKGWNSDCTTVAGLTLLLGTVHCPTGPSSLCHRNVPPLLHSFFHSGKRTLCDGPLTLAQTCSVPPLGQHTSLHWTSLLLSSCKCALWYCNTRELVQEICAGSEGSIRIVLQLSNKCSYWKCWWVFMTVPLPVLSKFFFE